jgi:hypothetical protein
LAVNIRNAWDLMLAFVPERAEANSAWFRGRSAPSPEAADDQIGPKDSHHPVEEPTSHDVTVITH